jgi:hypothetical protein
MRFKISIKKSRVKSIISILQVKFNSFTKDKVVIVINGKRVLGRPRKEVNSKDKAK